jgi:transcriptional regulator with XRE-family HTH domain
VPIAFWYAEEMRTALTTWHMGQVIRAYRTHPWHGRMLNQETVANWLHVTQAQLSRIEKGPSPDELSKLIHWAQILGVPAELLWFKLPEPVAPLDDQAPVTIDAVSPEPGGTVPQVPAATVLAADWRNMSDLERRAFLARVFGTVALPMLNLDELRHITAALDDARRYLDGSVVDYFRRRLAACAADDGNHGPRRTLPVVLGLLAAVEHSARQVRPGIRRELLAVGAESAEFAGWLYRDIGASDMAAYWRDRASEWAQEAGQFTLQGYVLLRKSQAAWDERDGLRMLTLTQAAQEGPWELPPKVRAEAAQQEARGHAMLGDDPNLMARKLDEARELVTETLESDDPAAQLSAHYDAPLLAMQTAICFDEAGQPTRAIELYEIELNPAVFSHRDYGYFRALMASSLAAAGEPDEAGAVGLGALSIARETNSTRTTGELQRVVERLEPWSARSVVQELRDSLLSV